MNDLADNGGATVPSDGSDGTPSSAANAASPAPEPNWRDSLPDDLRADATLAKYDTLEAAARAHLSTKQALSGDKIAIPSLDAPPEQWDAVYAKLGRPETPEGYEIPVIEGDAGDYAAAFRPIAHKLGLNAAQAKGLAEWQNSMLAAQAEARDTEAVAALEALKQKHGAAFPQYEAQAIAGFEAFRDVMGGPIDPDNPDAHAARVMALADQMTSVIGQAQFVELFAAIGKRMGEAPRIEGQAPNGLAIEGDAKSILDQKMKDKGWMEKFAAGDTETVAERDRLVDAVKHQALRKANGGA